MGVLIRGVKNAFRNTVRTLSVTLILAISIGLALIMLVSYRTVQAKIESVKGSIGNTVGISPAGAHGFEGGGEPLTEDQLAPVKTMDHVKSLSETLADRLTAGTDNNLLSAINAGTLGNRFGNQNQAAGGQAPPARAGGQARTFAVPITVTGISDPSAIISSTTVLSSGELFAADSSDKVAVIGKALATKNNLSVGSTFTAYATTITVKGIFDTGTQFTNAGLYMPLKTVQTLSNQPGQVSEATVTVDSIENIGVTTTAIKDKLGTDKADVISSQASEEAAVAPLENIKNITLYSLVGALVAGAVITLLTMIMIVRERRREIGVLKAIGSSNLGIMGQFVTESLVLTVMGSVVGIIAGALLSNSVLTVLVNNATSSVAPGGTGAARLGGGFSRGAGAVGQTLASSYKNLHAAVGLDILLYGLLAAILIAIVGSALPALFIANIKPAEVMRGE